MPVLFSCRAREYTDAVYALNGAKLQSEVVDGDVPIVTLCCA